MGGTRLIWDDILDGFDLRAGPSPGRDREAARAAALVQGDDDGRLAAVAAADAPRARLAIVRSGGPDDDELRGTEDDDTLRGLGGVDRLFGEGGEDDLFGGDNNDILHGGSETDTLFGDDGRDRLFGDAGVDRLVGGGDGDFYFVDDTDEVVDEDPGGGLDQVRSTVTFTLPDNVEILTLLGAAAIDGTGNELTNILNGNGARNVLSGLRGRDTLNGGADNDVLRGGGEDDDLFGGPNDDRLEGGAGRDTLNGGQGIDTFLGGPGVDDLSYEGAPGRVTVDLARGTAQADGGVERLSGIENAIGGEGRDRLIGDGNTNFLEGRGGNDVLIGGLAGFGGGGGPVVGTPVTGDGTLVDGLGGPAGFGESENALPPQDDEPSATVNLSSVFEDGLDFFSPGDPFTSVFINNNGNVTFGSAQSTFTPPALTDATGNPIIAPFFADVDTRPPAEGPPNGAVYWDLDPGRDIFTVTWSNVGYFNMHTDRTNSFQLQLYDRGEGDFDMVFRYGSIDWTVGDASGGRVARAGWNSGNGVNFFELPASGNQAQVLNLEAAPGNTGVRGLWAFQVRNGVIEGDPDVLDGGADNDRLVGGVGTDQLTGGPGRDRFEYGNRNEGGDTIEDFQLGQDVIDLSSVLTGFTPGASSPAAFIRVEATSRPGGAGRPPELGFTLSVDFDGGGDNFVAFATVFGAGRDVTVDQLVGGGAIDLVT